MSSLFLCVSVSQVHACIIWGGTPLVCPISAIKGTHNRHCTWHPNRFQSGGNLFSLQRCAMKSYQLLPSQWSSSLGATLVGWAGRLYPRPPQHPGRRASASGSRQAPRVVVCKRVWESGMHSFRPASGPHSSPQGRIIPTGMMGVSKLSSPSSLILFIPPPQANPILFYFSNLKKTHIHVLCKYCKHGKIHRIKVHISFFSPDWAYSSDECMRLSVWYLCFQIALPIYTHRLPYLHR